MTTTTSATRKVPAATNGKASENRRYGKAFGKLAIDAYERGVADFVALEKDAAKIAPYPWAKNALMLHADFVEDVGAAYVKTARAALR
jgi:hypothetical protein